MSYKVNKRTRREGEAQELIMVRQVEAFLQETSTLSTKIENMNTILTTPSSLSKFRDFLNVCGGSYINYLSFWLDVGLIVRANRGMPKPVPSSTSVSVMTKHLRQLRDPIALVPVTDRDLLALATGVYAKYVTSRAPCQILLSAGFKEQIVVAMGMPSSILSAVPSLEGTRTLNSSNGVSRGSRDLDPTAINASRSVSEIEVDRDRDRNRATRGGRIPTSPVAEERSSERFRDEGDDNDTDKDSATTPGGSEASGATDSGGNDEIPVAPSDAVKAPVKPTAASPPRSVGSSISPRRPGWTADTDEDAGLLVTVPDRAQLIEVFTMIRREVLKAFAETTYDKYVASRQHSLWRAQQRAHSMAYAQSVVLERINRALRTGFMHSDGARLELNGGSSLPPHLLAQGSKLSTSTSGSRTKSSVCTTRSSRTADFSELSRLETTPEGGSASVSVSGMEKLACISVENGKTYGSVDGKVSHGVGAGGGGDAAPKLNSKGRRPLQLTISAERRRRNSGEGTHMGGYSDDESDSEHGRGIFDGTKATTGGTEVVATMCAFAEPSMLEEAVLGYSAPWLVSLLSAMESSTLSFSLHSPVRDAEIHVRYPYTYANPAHAALMGWTSSRRRLWGRSLDLFFVLSNANGERSNVSNVALGSMRSLRERESSFSASLYSHRNMSPLTQLMNDSAAAKRTSTANAVNRDQDQEQGPERSEGSGTGVRTPREGDDAQGTAAAPTGFEPADANAFLAFYRDLASGHQCIVNTQICPWDFSALRPKGNTSEASASASASLNSANSDRGKSPSVPAAPQRKNVILGVKPIYLSADGQANNRATLIPRGRSSKKKPRQVVFHMAFHMEVPPKSDGLEIAHKMEQLLLLLPDTVRASDAFDGVPVPANSPKSTSPSTTPVAGKRKSDKLVKPPVDEEGGGVVKRTSGKVSGGGGPVSLWSRLGFRSSSGAKVYS